MNINKDKKVESIKVKKNRKISELLSLMENTGFQGKNLAKTVSVFENMVRNPDVTILFGYAASLSTTGQWKIINWLLDNNYIDILVPTGANISEDIVEAMGGSYLQYSQNSNDSDLFEKGFNRYYDILGDESEYLEMTELIAEFILTLDGDYIYSSREFLKYFGDWLLTKNIDSIVSSAARNDVPIFCPAFADSPYGDAALIAKSKNFNLKIDAIKDYTEYMSLAEKVKETGVVYIGGGVPKDWIQLFSVTADLLYTDRKVPSRSDGRIRKNIGKDETYYPCLLYTSPSPRDSIRSRMPSSA